MVGPYAVGFDTIAFYVPNTLDWAAGKVGLLGMIASAPLIYMLSVPAYVLSRVNPVWIFKIMGPVLYGCMCWALFRFLSAGLRWSPNRALVGVLFTSLYFVTLRIGWDLYRNMLGLTFVLLALPLLVDAKGARNQLPLAVLLMLAVASDQLTAVLALTIVGMRALMGLRTRRDEFVRLLKTGLPGAGLFFLTVYAGQATSSQSLLQAQSAVPAAAVLGSSVGFLAYSFLPLLPLAIIGLRRIGSIELRIWSLACTAAAFIALLPFYGLTVESYRWSLLLDIPACVYASSGLMHISSVRVSEVSRTFRGFARAWPAIPLILTMSAALYMVLPAQNAMMYYAEFPRLVPTSMIQDSVPLSDMGSLRQALNWVAERMGPNSVLIAHQAVYGWARAYLPASDNVISYGYSTPLTGVSLARSYGYSTLWVIWWTPGAGWHGQPSVSSDFTGVFQEGNIEVYTLH